MNLLSSFDGLDVKEFKTKWQAPSNIAFVKYWGKKGHQLPSNPSLSLTLSDCKTETEIFFKPAKSLSVELFLDNESKPNFAKKIHEFLLKLSADVSWLNHIHLTIHTHNTFPHGTGIASSASGMAALCLGIADYFYFLKNKELDEDFFQLASFLSRLASGSASRSVYGGFVSWGEFETEEGMCDFYASPFKAHESFQNMKDSVIIVSSQEKVVSSRQGHSLMGEHPYAQARFIEAFKNFKRTIDGLRSGDWKSVGEVLENEALQLHAMMLTSPESYTLFKPESLSIIERVRRFRNETGTQVYFTLDAGPNVHLIYPGSIESEVKEFIAKELTPFAELIIHDSIGKGPVKC